MVESVRTSIIPQESTIKASKFIPKTTTIDLFSSPIRPDPTSYRPSERSVSVEKRQRVEKY